MTSPVPFPSHRKAGMSWLEPGKPPVSAPCGLDCKSIAKASKVRILHLPPRAKGPLASGTPTRGPFLLSGRVRADPVKPVQWVGRQQLQLDRVPESARQRGTLSTRRGWCRWLTIEANCNSCQYSTQTGRALSQRTARRFIVMWITSGVLPKSRYLLWFPSYFGYVLLAGMDNTSMPGRVHGFHYHIER